MGYLYRIRFPNGKAYIGITIGSSAERLRSHAKQAHRGSVFLVHLAMRKYAGQYSSETLIISDDWKYLCELERRAIVVYGTKNPNGHNLTDGGEGVTGCSWVLSQETKDKMRAKAIGNSNSLGFKHSVETLAKRSAAAKNQSAESMAKRSITIKKSWETRSRIQPAAAIAKRIVTNAAKQKNALSTTSANTSGFRGVCFHAPTGKWQASIRVNTKRYYLGIYTTPMSAYEAYVEAKRNLLGATI